MFRSIAFKVLSAIGIAAAAHYIAQQAYEYGQDHLFDGVDYGPWETVEIAFFALIENPWNRLVTYVRRLIQMIKADIALGRIQASEGSDAEF